MRYDQYKHITTGATVSVTLYIISFSNYYNNILNLHRFYFSHGVPFSRNHRPAPIIYIL